MTDHNERGASAQVETMWLLPTPILVLQLLSARELVVYALSAYAGDEHLQCLEPEKEQEPQRVQ